MCVETRSCEIFGVLFSPAQSLAEEARLGARLPAS